MRIKVLSDGKVFEGSSEDIIRDMKMFAFGHDSDTLEQYAEWMAGQISEMFGESITLDPAKKLDSFIDEMLRLKLAERLPEN